MDQLPIERKNCAGQGTAKLQRFRSDFVEHGLKSRRRAADDVQYFTDGSLVFERFGELFRSCLHLLE